MQTHFAHYGNWLLVVGWSNPDCKTNNTHDRNKTEACIRVEPSEQGIATPKIFITDPSSLKVTYLSSPKLYWNQQT
jgi:hypothetical protein